MSKIPENILKILEQCHVDGNTLYLPEGQLDRPVYQAVNKVLENIGGKWDRKAKGHVFADDDPADLLDAVLLTGETVDLKKQFQFFPTPRPVAEKMCKLAELDDTCVVLEPSCGKGDLADVIYEAGVKELVGIELNPDMKKYLEGKPYTTLTGLDFLKFVNDPNIRSPWTRIVMNPPFSRQQDIDHILAAYNILAPGGILVSIVSESPFFRENKKSVDFRAALKECGAEIIPLEAGDFKESGTMVRTRIIKVRKEGQLIQLPEPDVEREPAHKQGENSMENNVVEMPRDYQALAKEKIAAELKGFTGGRKEKAVSEHVAATLTHFCEENTTFAEVVYRTKRTLSDCCAEIMKGSGDYVSNIDVYRGAVRHYFPNSDIKFFVEFKTTGAPPTEEEMAKLPEKPKAKPQPAKPAAKAPAKKPAPVPKPKKQETETIQLSLF